MAEKDHPWDGVADDLFAWMQGEVNYYVEALRGGYRTPFSAPVSEKDKLDYYRRQMYQVAPDGTVQYDTPNAEGRDRILKQYGTATYAQIMDAVRPKPGLRPSSEPTVDALEAGMPSMPEDEEPV